MVRLYLLGVLGAVLGALADAGGVLAARGWHPRAMYALTVCACAATAPVWLAVTRASGGRFMQSAVAWTFTGTCCTCIIAALSGDHESRRQWLGFALIVAGVIVRVTDR